MELLIAMFLYYCPSDMIKINKYCIDKYEAPNIFGTKPFVMKTANDATSWCLGKGKRLCKMNEWVKACEGTYKSPPNILVSGVVAAPAPCNNDKRWITVHGTTLVLGSKIEREKEALRLWQGETSGFRPQCVSDQGVYDTIGNVEEWVESPRDTYGVALMGHYWSRAAKSCTHRVTAHDRNFFYYSTGFRCCQNALRY